MSGPCTRWSAERTERLREMHRAGHSDAEMGAALGISRNAAGSHRRRLGLPSNYGAADGAFKRRAAPVAPAEPPTPPREPVFKPPKTGSTPPMPGLVCDSPDLPPDHHGAYAVLALGEGTCRWPVGDPKSPAFRFCCAPRTHVLLPYCPSHTAAAHLPAATTRRAA